jgi:hypothetical protein
MSFSYRTKKRQECKKRRKDFSLRKRGQSARTELILPCGHKPEKFKGTLFQSVISLLDYLTENTKHY